MDDIVTRLRDYLAIVDHAFVWNELSDAADEIERLRKQAELWKRAARCWQAVAYGGSTVSAEQARDAITEAEDHERRV